MGLVQVLFVCLDLIAREKAGQCLRDEWLSALDCKISVNGEKGAWLRCIRVRGGGW